MELSENEKGYLAGMLDGEGSVMLYENKADRVIRLVIQVTVTTNPLIFEKVRSLLSKAGWKFGMTTTKANHVKGFRQAWMLQLRRIDDQKQFIAKVGPFIAGKAEHLKLASAFLARRDSGRKVKPNVQDELLIARIKQLNGRGLKSGSVTTVRVPPEKVKIQSELYGDIQRSAEMTDPAAVN